MASTLETGMDGVWPKPGTMFVPLDLELLRANGVNTAMLPDSLQPIIAQGFLRADQLIDPNELQDPERSLFHGAFHDLCRKRGINESDWRTSVVPMIRAVVKGYIGKKPRRSGEAYYLHPLMVATAALLYAPKELCPDEAAVLRLTRSCLMHDYVEDVIFKQEGLPSLRESSGPHDAEHVEKVFVEKFVEAEKRLLALPELSISSDEARIIMALTVDQGLNIDGAKLSNHYTQIDKLSTGSLRELAAFARCMDKAVNLFAGEGDPKATAMENVARWNKQVGEALEYTIPIYDHFLTPDTAGRRSAGHVLRNAASYAIGTMHGILGSLPQDTRDYAQVADDVQHNEDVARGFILSQEARLSNTNNPVHSILIQVRDRIIQVSALPPVTA